MERMIAKIAASFVFAMCAFRACANEDEYPEFYRGDDGRGEGFVQAIKVLAPKLGSNIKGDITVVFEAKGMEKAVASCWRQDRSRQNPHGMDETLFDGALDGNGMGEFVFHGDSFPNGPLTIRIRATSPEGARDYFELQVYNLGGVKWRQGLPSRTPSAAKGMKLVFADDFNGPISITSDGRGARYAAHKTGGGDFSGWPFSDPDGDMLPFSQQGSFLRIHASKPRGSKGMTGIISSIRADGSGVAVPVPAYFESRILCHSAPGSWGAFWTLSKGVIGMDPSSPDYAAVKAQGCDELDILECYGGYGPHNPNHGGKFGVTTHWWGQADAGKAPHAFPDAMQMAGRSAWSWTFHNYGLLITEADTVYYFDGVEVMRHPTGPVTKSQDTWFLLNYAIGGISGWPIDMERYGNESDMWVDWVRVYCGKPMPEDFGEIPPVGVKGSVGINFTDMRREKASMRPFDIAGAPGTAQANWNNCEAGRRGEMRGLVDSEGAASPIAVSTGETAAFEPCESWGFGGGDERLHRGGVRDAEIRISGIPSGRYDLIVHFSAGINGWNGVVAVLDGLERELERKSVNFGWIGGGRYVEAASGGGSPDCFAVFRDLAGDTATIRFGKRGGKGNAAVAGVQIVPARKGDPEKKRGDAK